MTEKDESQWVSRQELQISPRAPQPRRRGGIVRRLVFLAFGLVIIFLSLFWIPTEIHYRVRETYHFTAENNTSLNLVVLLPTSGAYQRVADPEIVWQGDWEMQADGRLNVLRMRSELEAGESISASITYQVDLYQGQAVWVGKPVGPEDLEATDDVQAQSPELIALAESLAVSGDQSQSLRQFYDFTRHHLSWPVETRIDQDLSALAAYRSGVGGCAERANLLAALARRTGIPARVVSGLSMPEWFPFIPKSVTWGHPAGAHAWNEVFIGSDWWLVDASRADPFYERNLFGWTDGKHLAYDTITSEARVYHAVLQDAESDGNLIAAMSAPLRFVAWSDAETDSVVISPEVTIQKTWDGRLLMIVASFTILAVLLWLIETEPRADKI